ncbi:MAG: 16S rRNA (guanine(527)-N(7))-methyltransferase RsmG [Clostridiales bacterium]|nr:16S rRNA (guanine(527)-N(7))-methyltransferase RsmG [Clostridiales bacterium]
MEDRPSAELDELLQGALSLGVALSPPQGRRLLSLWDAVEAAGKRVNLTALRDRREALEKHLLDSIALLAWRPCGEEGLRVVDVGSGGGFPGLALKAVCPGWRVTLLEATGKKVRALEEVAGRLGWEVETVWGRAEDEGRGKLREAFALATARALASPWVALEWVLPLVAVGGEAWFWWGPGTDPDDIRQDLVEVAGILGARLLGVRPYRLPFSGAERRLWGFKKDWATPDEYPRRVGVAQRKPLGRLGGGRA